MWYEITFLILTTFIIMDTNEWINKIVATKNYEEWTFEREFYERVDTII